MPATTEVLGCSLAEVSDVDFIALIALRRFTYGHEVWRVNGTRAAKIAIRQLNEYLLMGAPTTATIHPSLDKLVPIDAPTLVRAYRIFLERAPSEAEQSRWLSKPYTSAAELCADLLESFESYQVDGLTEQATEEDFEALREVHHHTRTHDAFIRHMTRDRTRPSIGAALAGPLTRRPLRVVSTIGPNDDADRQLVVERLAAMGVEARLSRIAIEEVVNGSAFADCDVFLTVNQHIYDRQEQQLAAIRDASAVTICWHMDNHHEFGLSARFTSVFDYIFPSHPGAQACLHGGPALVGTVVPCGSNQWTAAEAKALFADHGGLARTGRLYGRFNSYAGRNALRDDFLRAVSDRISSDVAVVEHGQNDWFARMPADRFRDLSMRKVVLCGVIYNDVSLRLFDALLAGALPIVPYGLPGLGLAFDLDDPDVPVIQYRPENIESLECAIDDGCKRFDREGYDGIRARHRMAFDRHLLRNRVAQILAEVVGNTAHR